MDFLPALPNFDYNNAIKKSLNYVFETDIQCSNRFFEALKYRTDNMTGIPPYGLWMSAMKLYPQIIEFMINKGFRLENIKWNRWPKVEKSNIIQDWVSSLQIMFSIAENEENFSQFSTLRDNQLYNDIKLRGQISIIDCLIGTLKNSSNYFYPNSAVSFLYAGINNVDDVEIPSYSESPEKHEQSIKQYFSWASSIGSQLKEWALKNDLVEENLFILTYEENKIRIKPFTVFNIGLIEHPVTRDSGIWKGRTNVIESANIQLNYSLLLLEDLINSNAKEQEFQKFFELNPQFLLLLGNYKKLHPQLILKEDNGSNLIPDFFMEKVDSDFCDILDLKRPTAELVRPQKNRVRFRECVMEAVAQLKYYRDWFDDKQNRVLFKNKYGLNSFKPQVVIIIGRKQNYYDEVTKIQLETTLPRWVTLATYDDIIGRVKQWKNFTSLY